MRGAALLALAAAACSAPAASTEILPAGHAHAPAWQARQPGGIDPIDPGVDLRSGRTATDLLDPAGCARCHADIAAEWARSRHALAWTNGIFQREYAARPQQWCVNCHAPLTTQQQGAFTDAGVDCATCHLRGGRLVAARARANSPHQITADPSFGSPAFCADCHQFSFPVLGPRGEVEHMTDHPMQTTVASFAAGPFARERDGCMTCHGSRHDHAYLGGHDPGMLGAALEIAWCRADTELHLSIKNAAAGHTVPTGDIHRHFSLRAWRSTAPEALFDVFLGRRFEPSDDGGKTTTWDSTLAPGEVRTAAVPLERLGGDADEPVNLELTYVFIEAEFPRPARAPDEPATTSVLRWRKAPADIPACE